MAASSKPRISLDPAPRFEAEVPIPQPDRSPVEVTFTFKHRDREQLSAWIESLEGREGTALEKDVAMVMDVADGWELAEPFNADNVRRLLVAHSPAAAALYLTYVQSLRLGKQKN
jgi:hypothetical protein